MRQEIGNVSSRQQPEEKHKQPNAINGPSNKAKQFPNPKAGFSWPTDKKCVQIQCINI